MERRDFLTNLTAAGVLSMFDPGYLNAKEARAAGTLPDKPLERRLYGRTQERLSIIGFGGILVMNTSPKSLKTLQTDHKACYPRVLPSFADARLRLATPAPNGTFNSASLAQLPLRNGPRP